MKQEYLKNSSIEYFPTLIQEKRFSDINRNLTIFVEQNKNGNLKGIYIKEKISDNENFKRKAPGRNNHNAPKLIEKYNDLAREALSNGDISNNTRLYLFYIHHQ